jgi:hypothetical protein
MSALSDYLENKLIDYLFRAQAFAAPTSVFAALFTAGPTDTGGGTELAGNNYARIEIACGLTTFNGTHGTTSGASTGTSGSTSNAEVIQFDTPSANWGTVTHFALFDAVSGGNMLVHGQLAIPKIINTSDDVKFNIGALTIQIDD